QRTFEAQPANARATLAGELVASIGVGPGGVECDELSRRQEAALALRCTPVPDGCDFLNKVSDKVAARMVAVLDQSGGGRRHDLRGGGEAGLNGEDAEDEIPIGHLAASWRGQRRRDRKPVRSSPQKSSGCSQAAKCPPWPSLL